MWEFSKTPSNLIGTTPGSRPRSQSVKASYDQSVLLTDWWLIEVKSNSQGSRVGVAGFASRRRQAIRRFKSIAIVKRHDAVTLETEDGITIVITNHINISESLRNGFPPEVCSHFLSGFPYYWKDISGKWLGEKHTSETRPSRTSSVNGTATFPDDIPVVHVRDILLLSNGDSARCLIEKCISSHIPRKEGNNAFKDDLGSAKAKGKSKRQEDDINDDSRLMAGDLSGDASRMTPNASNIENSKEKGHVGKDNVNCPKPKDKRQEDDTNNSDRIVAGELSGDATPKTQHASKVGEKSKYKGGILCSQDPRNLRDSAFNDDDLNFTQIKCKRKRQEDDTTDITRLVADDLSDDATPENQNASKVVKNRKGKGGIPHSTVPEKENTRKVKAVRGRNIGENSSRMTTRSMSRSKNLAMASLGLQM